MKKFRHIGYLAAALILILFSNSAASRSATIVSDAAVDTIAPELPVPPDVHSVHNIAYLKLTAAINPTTKLPALYYHGATTPPTIRVRPGDTLVIDYSNRLPQSSTMPFDMSNLHTHGLMVSPDAPGDQVIMTMVMPGQTYRYVFNVPRNQPPGLYWYHPHPHGESNRQVAAGMSGMLIVEGLESYAPVIRGLAQRDIILRDFYVDPSIAPLSRERQRAVMHEAARERAANSSLSLSAAIHSAVAQAGSLPPSAPDCDVRDASKGVTINGLPSATISMRRGTRQLFRIVNAAANSFFDLRIPGARMLVVANDGVPLSFHDSSLQAQWVDHVLIPPAGRVEAVVSAPEKNGTPLQTLCVDYGSAGDVDPNRPLARIELRGEPPLHYGDISAAAPAAEPFGPISAAPIVARRVVDFSENNPDSMFYINGKMWDPAAPPMFTVRAGTVEEWTVRNFADELHAFHIHQIHFLVEDVDGVRQPKSAWRDTVTLPYAQHLRNGQVQPSVVHLLMDFRDPIIVGTFVFHCHILEHEDYGMMAKIRVIGAQPTAVTTRRGYHQGFIH